MQEGAISLMQMPRTVIATRMVKEAGLPFIVVLSDPTTGGVTASFAMLGDIQIAEPGALIGFAGARVIEQTVREKLPEGFQRAEYLLEHGILDMVVKRDEMRATLARLIGLLRVPEGASAAFERTRSRSRRHPGAGPPAAARRRGTRRSRRIAAPALARGAPPPSPAPKPSSTGCTPSTRS